ncbi:hypothetical protein DXX92_18085 [Thalassotalea euphylliae]|uniref:HPr-rel-A system PqqD family peptide chaperone n=1 Tax=Thalassotalea euphylliae TaxID=1655234 RepID=A0A3E0UJJ9_9GAMM|nr:hypothetical protein DXX92_18085 [Thalassotalea euphylliae]
MVLFDTLSKETILLPAIETAVFFALEDERLLTLEQLLMSLENHQRFELDSLSQSLDTLERLQLIERIE